MFTVWTLGLEKGVNQAEIGMFDFLGKLYKVGLVALKKLGSN